MENVAFGVSGQVTTPKPALFEDSAMTVAFIGFADNEGDLGICAGSEPFAVAGLIETALHESVVAFRCRVVWRVTSRCCAVR